MVWIEHRPRDNLFFMSRLAALLLVLLPWLVPACGGESSNDRVVLTVRRGAVGPRVLIVVAHPDDEIAFAGAAYKTTTHLDGVVDLLTITNGEGGFKYSTLAEELYGLELTDEAIGRRHLPEIRRRELIEGCRQLRMHTITFLSEVDHRYTQDPTEVLAPDAEVWDLERVRKRIDRALANGEYDFVLGLAPTATTHGHHQAATILAAQAVARMPQDERPAMLAVRSRRGTDESPTLRANSHAPEVTQPLEHPPLVFDRAQKFGHKDKLDYSIVANWAISAHKSQGTMQMYVGPASEEHYFALAPTTPEALERATAWIARLEEPQFEVRTYGESAGSNAR